MLIHVFGIDSAIDSVSDRLAGVIRDPSALDVTAIYPHISPTSIGGAIGSLINLKYTCQRPTSYQHLSASVRMQTQQVLLLAIFYM